MSSSASSSSSTLLEAFLKRVALVSSSHPLPTLLAACVLTLLAFLSARQLTLSTDLVELLPEDAQSVQDLERLKSVFGGFGYVVVVGRAAEPSELARFATDVAPALKALDAVQYVDFQRPDGFFEDHGLLYLELPELESLYERLKARYDHERRKRNPLMLGLADDEPAPELDFSDLTAKYANVGGDFLSEKDAEHGLHLDPEKRIVALFVKPREVGTDIGSAKRIVEDVERVVSELDVSGYGPDFEVVYGGTYVKKVEQADLIRGDLGTATVVALTAVLLYVWWHFRRLTAAFLLFVPLGMGLLWSYGFATLLFGQLNILTGFIGAILAGLGIDHGIHLVERFEAEHGQEPDGAIERTFGDTGRAVVLAGLTTAAGCAGLSLSDFLAFKQFGMLASAGVLFLTVTYLWVLPALLRLVLDFGWRPRQRSSRESAFAAWLPRRARLIAAMSLAVLAALAYNARGVSFDYDTRTLAQSELLSFQLDFELDALLGRSQTPVVVLAESAEDQQTISDTLGQRKQNNGDGSAIHLVTTRSDLVPPDQSAKLPILSKLNRLAKKMDRDGLDDGQRVSIRRLEALTNDVETFDLSDVPEELTRVFHTPSGQDENFVLVFSSLDLADARNAMVYSDELSEIDLGSSLVSAAGEPIVMAEVYRMVGREVAPVFAVTSVVVFLVTWLLMGNLRYAMICMIPAVATTLGTAGLMSIAGLKFNTLNICVIPVLFGISVDGGIHLVNRIRAGVAVGQTLNETGQSIAAALVTTGLGFGAMCLANHTGLQSLGLVSLLGVSANMLACIVLLPSLVSVLGWNGR